MVDTDPKAKMIEIPEDTLKEILANQEESKRKIVELEAANMVNQVLEGKKDIRELESLEERFKVKEYRLHKVKLVDGEGKDKGGIVVGWTERGAYDVWDKSGPNAEKVIMMDVFFLDKNGKRTEKSTTITAMQYANAERVVCKEVSKAIKIHKHKSGEEIEVMEWPKDGRANNLVSTGVIIDGYYATPEGTITVQVPGYEEPVIIDQKFF